MRRGLQNKSRKNKSKRSKRSKRSKQTLRKHKTRHIRGGDQETDTSLELVPIDKTAMVAGPGFSMSAGEYEDMMSALDRDGADY